MPAGLTVPTIFTAVDRLSATVSKMAKSVTSFSKVAGTSILRLNDKFNNFFKLGDLQKQFLSFASTAAVAAMIISGLKFSFQSMVDYEQNIAHLHGLLSNLTNSGFAPFQHQVDLVAKGLQYSAVDVAAAFAKIAELNIGLAKTPGSIGAVAAAAITLSRAANIELTPATEGLVSIMAQFGLQGRDANRVINVLAAGLKYGSANITDQVEAYKNFGTVAKTANITLEQSTALVQTLGKYQLKGADAGTALRGVIVRLQKAGAGYKSGLFNINDALADATRKYNSLSTARKKDAFLISLFGLRQITAGRILLNNSALIADLTKKVTGSNQAFAQAAINTDTVAGAWKKLVAQFVNYITGNDKAKAGMLKLKDAIYWVTRNLDTIIDTVITFVKWFLIIKGVLWTAQTAMAAYNIVQGIFAATTTTATSAVAAETIVVGGFGSMLSGVTAEFGLAETAASSFFATLGAFVIPAAITALAGFALYKAFSSESARADAFKFRDSLDNNPKERDAWVDFQTKLPGQATPADASAFQKWWASRTSHYNVNVPSTIVNPALAGQDQGLTPAPVFGRPELKHNSDGTPVSTPQIQDIHIFLHDPAGNVKKVVPGKSGHIHVKVTSTTGQT